MAENTGIENSHDDDLLDEALDRSSGVKACGITGQACICASAKCIGRSLDH